MSAITGWPVNERPREKLMLYGAKNLSDAELLAIMINTGTPGKTALDLARNLLQHFGELKKILQLSFQELRSIPGLGQAKYVLLQAALELGNRYLNSSIQLGETLNSTHLTQNFLSHRLKHYAHEVFACLFLDNQNRLLKFAELFSGTLTEASVYPREVVKHALSCNAAKLILAHNHPSGDPTPSQADLDITQRLACALKLVDIYVIDHIIVGANQTISFAERGLIAH